MVTAPWLVLFNAASKAKIDMARTLAGLGQLLVLFEGEHVDH